MSTPRRRQFHTTFSQRTLDYVGKKSRDLGLSMGETFDWLVEQQIKRDYNAEEKILKEVTKQVLADYYKRELAV